VISGSSKLGNAPKIEYFRKIRENQNKIKSNNCTLFVVGFRVLLL
jgi:hypothetical protein